MKIKEKKRKKKFCIPMILSVLRFRGGGRGEGSWRMQEVILLSHGIFEKIVVKVAKP